MKSSCTLHSLRNSDNMDSFPRMSSSSLYDGNPLTKYWEWPCFTSTVTDHHGSVSGKNPVTIYSLESSVKIFTKIKDRYKKKKSYTQKRKMPQGGLPVYQNTKVNRLQNLISNKVKHFEKYDIVLHLLSFDTDKLI